MRVITTEKTNLEIAHGGKRFEVELVLRDVAGTNLDALSKHSEVIVLAMHVAPAKAKDNIIVASNFGRIGKKGDDDDMKVINSGEPIVGVYGEGKRYGVELPLRDAANKTIGALSLGFRYNSGDDEKAFLARAEKVRDELQKRIPSVEK